MDRRLESEATGGSGAGRDFHAHVERRASGCTGRRRYQKHCFGIPQRLTEAAEAGQTERRRSDKWPLGVENKIASRQPLQLQVSFQFSAIKRH